MDSWPQSVLRLAVDGGLKQFVAHSYVQALVDEAWRGAYVGNKWALPPYASLLLVLRCFCGGALLCGGALRCFCLLSVGLSSVLCAARVLARFTANGTLRVPPSRRDLTRSHAPDSVYRSILLLRIGPCPPPFSPRATLDSL